MRPRWQRTARRDVYTVDVTAFLSLMVILVPFLLVTAVFSRATILEIQSLDGEDRQVDFPDPLQLQVIVRQSVIEVISRDAAQAVLISRSAEGSELTSLAALAAELKARHPQSRAATLLLEPRIPYDFLVQVLDALRIRLATPGETGDQQELFPAIALGTAPGATHSGRNTP